ncbi:MAG: LPP20 family lipoprotein [Treponema sp.]|jgi:hypothetical protein|nr:LPP20 family lipoprotein [Treponema sp.]
MFRTKLIAFSRLMNIFYLLAAFTACGTVTLQNRSAAMPDWVRDPYRKFDRQANVAAVGTGSSANAAEKDAFGKLVAVFGQSIQVDEKISTSYREALRSGAASSWTENTAFDSMIAMSAGMDSLIGAEIGAAWDDGKINYYAAAVLNKVKALQVYSNLVTANKAMIFNLVNMPEAEKITFEGFARYQLAASVADVTITYGNLLTHIGDPSYAQGLKKGDEYRLEAQNIAKSIPVGIKVTDDRAGKIQGAFAKALSDIGFRSGGNNPRYVLEADISVFPVDFPNNPNKFARIELNANLTDTSVKSVLLPFNYSAREGHPNISEAENRAYNEAVRAINEGYKDLLLDYMSNLLPN